MGDLATTVTKELFPSGAAGVHSAPPSSIMSSALRELLAPVGQVTQMASSGEMVRHAAELQKELNVTYDPAVMQMVIPMHTPSGNVHLIQRHVQSGASYVHVNASFYNSVKRRCSSLGFQAEGLTLGVMDTSMRESNQLQGLIVGGHFFHVTTCCVFCPPQNEENHRRELLAFLSGQGTGKYTITAFQGSEELAQYVHQVSQTQLPPS